MSIEDRKNEHKSSSDDIRKAMQEYLLNRVIQLNYTRNGTRIFIKKAEFQNGSKLMGYSLDHSLSSHLAYVNVGGVDIRATFCPHCNQLALHVDGVCYDCYGINNNNHGHTDAEKDENDVDQGVHSSIHVVKSSGSTSITGGCTGDHIVFY